MKRTNIPDAEIFKAAIQDEISRTSEGRYFHRLHAILHILDGASSHDTARLYGDSTRAIEYWVQRLISKGLSGLLDGNHPGRPARLSARDLAKLRKDISRTPRELGYNQNLWDGMLLSHHITQKYSVSLSVRQCQRLFHQLGFSLQRPRRKASEADGSQQVAFKKLLPVNARYYHSTMVRGRSPFSTPQQFDKNVGTQRSTTSRTLAFSPSQSRFFRSTQFENRSACDSRSSHFQWSNFRRFYSLSAPIYSGQNLPNFGQCQMAQIQRSQRFLRSKSASPGIYLPAGLFSRTQSDRTSLENHSSQSNPQPVFSINRRPSVGSSIPIYNLEVI